MFLFLPAEHRRADGRRDHGQQEARIGQNRRGLRQFAEVDFRGAAAERRLRELLRDAPRFDVVARQLVDAVQERRHRHTGAGGEHVRLQMGAQRVRRVALQRARRDRVAGPGQHGRGDQQCFMRHALVLDDERFAMRFRHVGERTVGVRMILLKMVERGIQSCLVGVANDLG